MSTWTGRITVSVDFDGPDEPSLYQVAEAVVNAIAGLETPIVEVQAPDDPHWFEVDLEEREHLRGWAPGNLQHHLIFGHNAAPSSVPYDGPLNEIHKAMHAEEEK